MPYVGSARLCGVEMGCSLLRNLFYHDISPNELIGVTRLGFSFNVTQPA
jgi:hypothetical protein